MNESSEEKISIETPEQIQVEFPLAGIGSRFLALVTDTVFQLVVGFVLFMTVLIVSSSIQRSGSTWLAAMLLGGSFVIQFGYFAFFEAIWRGQTPGKRRENLRVIKDDGSPITVFDAVARNLLRIVDSLPGFYAVGIVSVFCSGKNKRLGDFLAGTIVVHDQPIERSSSLPFRTSAAAPAAGGGSGSDPRITEEQFQLLETYLARRYELETNLRYKLRGQIMERMAAVMEVAEEDRQDPDSFIERLVGNYRNRS